MAAAAVPFPEFQAPALAVFTDRTATPGSGPRTNHPIPHAGGSSIASGASWAGSCFPRVRLLAARGDRVWGWTTGSLDEAIILKFRVNW